ncbi:hypothetical protein TL16_g12551 [Triparma laevis f. inornata]|uniref:Transmembrane protein n=1 Tax=Triparma laevis f. inornata TaxID=1714386 RepID=A0A9W7BVI6_9STRA|nr:hypothetical protein TL16_g12551 [Triparma laevis f. inornata]
MPQKKNFLQTMAEVDSQVGEEQKKGRQKRARSTVPYTNPFMETETKKVNRKKGKRGSLEMARQRHGKAAMAGVAKSSSPIYIFFLLSVTMNELPDDMLSAFMITRVFGKTLVAGVVQGAFLLFDGIRCTLRVRGDGKLHRECSRTLFGEVGIGCMLTLLLIALLMSGLVHKKHLKKLEIPMKKIVTGELQSREIVRILLVLFTTMCTLFLVGYYGTTGDFKDDTELHIAIGFLVTGLTTLVVLLLWVFWEILSAVRAEEQELGSGVDQTMPMPQRLKQKSTVYENAVKPSRFWTWWSWFGTTVYTGLMFVACVMDEEWFPKIQANGRPEWEVEEFTTVLRFLFPLAFLPYVINIFVHYENRDKWTMRWQWVQFFKFIISPQIVWYVFHSEDFWKLTPEVAALKLFILAGYIFLNLSALWFRQHIAKLGKKSVSIFLVDNVFKVSFIISVPILYVVFQSFNCILELDAKKCHNLSYVSQMLGGGIVIGWILQCVVYVNSKNRPHNEFKYTWNKIAKMHCSKRQLCIFVLFTLSMFCAMFLFANMSHPEPGSYDGDKAERNFRTLQKWAVTCLTCLGLVYIFELVVAMGVLKRAKKKAVQRQASGEASSSDSDSDEDSDSESSDEMENGRGRGTSLNASKSFHAHFVSECSWHFIIMSLISNIICSAFTVVYAVEHKKHDYAWRFAMFLAPANVLLFILCIFMKPKRRDSTYDNFLKFHFFAFIVVSEVAMNIGNFRFGVKENLYGFTHIILLLFVWLPVWYTLLLIRKLASKLEGFHLSRFLSETIIKDGFKFFVPIIYFTFETLACFVTEGGDRWLVDPTAEGAEECENTQIASFFLSIMLICHCIEKIALGAVKDAVLYQLGAMTPEKAFTLKELGKRQQFQCVLLAISVMCFLGLFGAMGVKESPRIVVLSLGGTGCGTAASNCLINIWSIFKADFKVSRRRRSQVEIMEKLYKKDQKFNSFEYDQQVNWG